MKIIKILIASTAFIAASQAFATTGMVRFSGQVIDETCVAGVNTSSSATRSVILPSVNPPTLSTIGSTVGDTAFNITITSAENEKCDVTTKVAGIYFEPNNPSLHADGRLKNRGDAQNVEVRLLSNEKRPINLTENRGTQQSTKVMDSTYKYYAQYYSAGAATAGDVVSDVNYTIIYK